MTLESRNPFYLALILTSVLFVVTAMAYALVPWNEQPSWLQVHGWKCLLVLVAAIIVFGFLSMALDRWRAVREDTGPPP